MSEVPERLLENAIDAPSGDQAGSTWKKIPAGVVVSTSVLVRRFWRLPSAFIS